MPLVECFSGFPKTNVLENMGGIDGRYTCVRIGNGADIHFLHLRISGVEIGKSPGLVDPAAVHRMEGERTAAEDEFDGSIARRCQKDQLVGKEVRKAVMKGTEHR